ncbi:MAG: GIY-YIG nuclease family protein [Parcubacteria group bacterium]|nr:GIY-YIG nuclease family protein [Parcubacteria group bacterium]
MYFVYVLKSLKNGDVYVGSTDNVNKRLRQHNYGKVRSTKFYRPWKLLEYREFQTRSEAVRYERFLKTSQQKEMLKHKYGRVAK